MNSTNSINLTNYLVYFLLAATFAACYYHTFGWLHYRYSYQDSYYSHGYMIPFISAYLIYLKRDKLKEMEISGSIIGLPLLIFSFLIHIIAVMSDINFVSGFSMLFFILGCTLYLFGGKITKELSFPILFLLFMFPVPGTFIDIIGLPTKSFSTTIGLGIIDLINIPYFLDGFRIELSSTSMFVGTPCNGMKSLVSFSALGLLALYLMEFAIWKRIIILICIYPISILVNAFRIAMLVFIADKYGIEKASPESYLHDLSGMIVFIPGLLVLFLVIKIWKPKNQ